MNSHKKKLHPHYYKRKFCLLTRNTQFNDQFSKHRAIPPYCQFCKNQDNNVQIKGDPKHALFTCQNVKNLPTKCLKNFK